MTTPQTLRRGRRLLIAAALVAAATLIFTGTAAAATVTLSPASQTATTGQSVTLTANLSPATTGEPTRFTVTSGPNAGQTFNTTTDANGNATWTYSSSLTGTDHVQATVIRFQITSNDATVTWNPPAPPKSDVQLTITTAPPITRVGANATWTASLTNAGPDTATGVLFQATGPAGATLVSATASRGNGCSASTCAIGTLAAGASATVTVVYTIGQAGSLTFAASVQSDFDTNPANNAASAPTTALQPGQPPPPPPPPSSPGTFNAIPTGTVLVNGSVQPADQQFVLPSGATVDVTNGILTLTVANGDTGNFSAARPTQRRSVAGARATGLPAVFTIEQPASGGVPIFTLTGGDFTACSTPRSVAASSKPIRALWGSVHGSFTTKGRFAAATVRGTIWLVQDRCDGTFEETVTGVVLVFDPARNKTVPVGAGGTYLVTPGSTLKRPTQSPAQVAKRGLVYGGKLYKTKAAFTARLKALGYAWADYAKKYPKIAAALARRR